MDASVRDHLLWRIGGPRENSGTTEPATVPVVPLFPKSSEYEVIIRKNTGTGPGTGRGLPVGIIEVIFSDVTMAKVRAG